MKSGLLSQFVKETILEDKKKRVREADITGDAKVPFGSSKHIKDLKIRIDDLTKWRAKQKRGSESRANYSRLISRLKSELSSASKKLKESKLPGELPEEVCLHCGDMNAPNSEPALNVGGQKQYQYDCVCGNIYHTPLRKQTPQRNWLKLANEIVAKFADADMSNEEIVQLLVQNGVPEKDAQHVANDTRHW